MTSTDIPKKWVIILLLSLFLLVFYISKIEWTKTSDSPQKSPAVHSARENSTNEKDTILLIWFWPFNRKFDLNACESEFHIKDCQLTDDRRLYSSADGVLIHHRDIARDLSNLPKLPRPYFQKWIWMLFESPQNSQRVPGLDNLFNVTMNYRQDADIVMREQLELKPQETEEPLKNKSKTVCWVVSNWNENHARVKYFNELKKHITVEAFGNHFQRTLSKEEYTQTMESCKFYLSFENTHERSDHTAIDYITEKLYNPLRLGAVPVVLGPPRHSYEKFIPKDSFIHVDDFNNPKELADYLNMLDQDEDKYHQFFSWQKHFRVTKVNFPLEHACRACQYIQNKKSFQVFTNLNKWYWDYLL